MSCTAVVTEEDIKAMINLGEEGGSLKEEEKELLHKVFEFGDTLASEAMRPRTEIVSVPSNATLQDVFALVSEFGYSRYPVIEDTVDTVIGILYIKDILVAMSAGEVKREDDIQRFIRPAYFIPENKRVSELLSEMQRERFQIAIVIDEYGGTVRAGDARGPDRGDRGQHPRRAGGRGKGSRDRGREELRGLRPVGAR